MIGMLWFDPTQRTLEEKVRLAAAYYERKYGRRPTLIAAHKSVAETMDDFFRLDRTAESQAWGRIYHAVCRGEKSVDRLANLAMSQ